MAENFGTILHIGTEKTGTTALQTILFRNRAALLERGISYPTGRLAHHQLVNCVAHPSRATEKLTEAEKQDCFHQLRAELSGLLPGSKVVVSSELCHSRLDSADAAQLLLHLAESGARVERIIVYFRDQCSLLESSYAEGVSAGLQWTHASQLEARFYYSHRQVTNRWLEAARVLVPPPEISVYSYSKHRSSLAEHFLRVIGVADTAGLDLSVVANARGSRAVIETVKRALASDTSLSGYAFAAWLKHIDPRPVRSFLDAAMRERVDHEFSDENRVMCKEFGLDPDDFPACAACSDIDDNPLDVEDLTRMLISAFRQTLPQA